MLMHNVCTCPFGTRKGNQDKMCIPLPYYDLNHCMYVFADVVICVIPIIINIIRNNVISQLLNIL